MRKLNVPLLAFLAVAFVVAQVVPAIAADCSLPVPVQIKPIGQPIWKPVDFHVFSAAVGTGDDGYAEFGQNQVNLLYPLRHKSCVDLGIGPGDPHQPPYKLEMQAGMDVMNFKDAAAFSLSQFTTPNGVWAVWMVVPNPGTTGSSPDFKSGPIIPNALFPIHVEGQTFRNNQLWNPYLGEFDIPALTTALSCPFSVDGHSHFPVFFADTSSFGPGGPLRGSYQFRITMTDANGNGWSITVFFAVL
ncbi:MAG TPA: hypothetical protein VMB19_08875 [Silvibacterium sp.]|nr:hypothetical protein [Silvibacterium sp.]